MSEVAVVGLDIAKNVFQVHCNDERGKIVKSKQIRRAQVLTFFANLKPCLVGLESCSGAHYWAREIAKLGHQVRLIPPQYVKPYVKTNKNDAADAEAIAEAVTRPNMRFVPIKSIQHHDIQSLHRVRDRLVRTKIAIINELHGLLIEYGVAIPKSYARLLLKMGEILSPTNSTLTSFAKETFGPLVDELKRAEKGVQDTERRMRQIVKENEVCQRLQEVPGVGVVTATALVASVVEPKSFRNGRQFAAWLGLVPKQASSGGKSVLLGISKRGDPYLRRMLIHGGRAVVRTAEGKKDRLRRWAAEKTKTRGSNRASVAVANKNARIIWKIMSSDEVYNAA